MATKLCAAKEREESLIGTGNKKLQVGALLNKLLRHGDKNKEEISDGAVVVSSKKRPLNKDIGL